MKTAIVGSEQAMKNAPDDNMARSMTHPSAVD
jgi:hypothetical protein